MHSNVNPHTKDYSYQHPNMNYLSKMDSLGVSPSSSKKSLSLSRRKRYHDHLQTPIIVGDYPNAMSHQTKRFEPKPDLNISRVLAISKTSLGNS